MSEPQRAHRRRWLVGVLVGVLALSACAPEPVAGWVPPQLEPVFGVEIISTGSFGSEPEAGADADANAKANVGSRVLGDTDAEQDASTDTDTDTDTGAESEPDAEIGDTSPGGGHDSGESGADSAGTAPADVDSTGAANKSRSMTVTKQRELGLYTGRLRNDTADFAARFVYVPGVPEFNNWVNGRIRDAIDATGVSYTPEAFPVDADLSTRGCVPGSTTWSGKDVLSRPETGPKGGSGTAVTCEVTGAFGNLVEVRMRTVTGSPGDITSDTMSLLYADVENGRAVEIAEEWNDGAAEELWKLTVEQLRREAGALSRAALADPDSEQLSLATRALERSQATDTGGLYIVIPAGLTAPELEGLGLAASDAPIEVLVEPSVALSWSNEDYRRLHEGKGQPFTATIAPVGTVPIDCTIFACVAVTYDDGPSGYTPRLLDALRAEQSRATFFMLGGKVAANADTVRRAVREGHELGSHTMDHPDLTQLPLPEAKAQVLDAAIALRDVSGQTITMFRPPYGAINDEVIEEVGLPAIFWSIDTNDWQVPGKKELVKRSVDVARPGSIILFHDTHSDSVDVAAEVLHGLRNRGLEPVTVTELFNGNVPEGRVSRT